MQNPPKRWEIFTSKKGCEGVYEFSRIFRWSCWKNDGGNGDSGGTGWRVWGSEESVLPKMKKKKKKEKRSKGVN